MKVGVRLTRPQMRVLGAILEGYRAVDTIAEVCAMSTRTTRHVLDALTRRNLVVPATETLYDALPRAAKAYGEQ